MKKTNIIFRFVFIIFFCLSGFVSNAFSQPYDGRFGIGVVLGEPSGVTGKYWMGPESALAGTAAWSFRGSTTIHLHLDYTKHNFTLITAERGSIAFVYGVGGRLLLGDRDRLGVRVPVGLAYFFDDHPLELFLEVAPILDLTPSTDFTGNSGLGLRYYF